MAGVSTGEHSRFGRRRKYDAWQAARPSDWLLELVQNRRHSARKRGRSPIDSAKSYPQWHSTVLARRRVPARLAQPAHGARCRLF
jgi:hypothetical protein